VTWTDLAFTGADGKPVISGPICNDDGTEGAIVGAMGITFAVVEPEGVLVAGSGGVPQGFWFATAVTE
jgi:hypothetical protein